jgi:protein-disulfide isomerase
MQKLVITIITAVILIVFGIVFFYFKAEENKLTEENEDLYAHNTIKEDQSAQLILAQKYQGLDIIYGLDNAPIKIIEYISYGCPHCAEFFKLSHQGYLQQYVSQGKIQLILRDFPLDEPSLRASQLVHCTAQTKRKQMVSVLLEKQSSWAHNKNFPEKLENLAKISGMSGGDFHECMLNNSLERSILASRVQAQNVFQVYSTPTIIINGNKYLGGINQKQLPKYLDSLLTKISKQHNE